MTFIVTLVALLIERFFDWSHLRSWQWYTNFQRAVTQQYPAQPPNLILVFTIVPLLIVTLTFQAILKSPLYGLVELAFQLLVLLYCLGPQNLWADTFSCINALVHGDKLAAAEKLKHTFGLTEAKNNPSLHGLLLSNLFIAANRRVFAIVFWFIVLGPAGAVLYRAITLSSAEFPQQEAAPALIKSARLVESVLDWVPARLFTWMFALAGNFVRVVSCWRKKTVFDLAINEALLTECGAAALSNDDDRLIADGSLVKNAVGLLDRAFIITLVIIAVIALIG